MTEPDIAGGGPALRPGVPVEEQVLQAAAGQRRRRLLGLVGTVAVLGAAALLASRAEPDPRRPVAAPTPTAVRVVPPPEPALLGNGWVADVAVSADRLYVLVGSCSGPEQARECSYRLLSRTRGAGWQNTALPPGEPFPARLLLTGEDTVTVLGWGDAAFVSRRGERFGAIKVRTGPALRDGVSSGLVPEVRDGRLVVLDPATGLLRALAAQPRLGTVPVTVAAGPLGDMWVAGRTRTGVVVAHSPDRGRQWEPATPIPGLRRDPQLRLVAAQDGGASLLAGRPEPERPLLTGIWRAGPGSGRWRRLTVPSGLRAIRSAVAGRNGLVVTGASGLWRVSPDGRVEQLPDPSVRGVTVSPTRLVAGPSGVVGWGLAPPLHDHLLISADDGDSWLPVPVPG